MGADKPVIRVTQLEQFRKWMSDKYEFVTEQSVIDSLSGAFRGNEKTICGTAFHSIVETGKPQCSKADNGRTFDIDGNTVILGLQACRLGLEYRSKFPWAYHEIRRFKDYGKAIVTGQADVIFGNEIRDIKTRFSPVRDERDYSDSCQWKFYCDMFGVDKFQFDIFIFDGYNEGMTSSPDGSGYGSLTVDVRLCTLAPYDPPIVCYPYRDMSSEILNLLDEFIYWAKERKVTNYLYFTE